MLVPDHVARTRAARSLGCFSLLLGLAGAMLGYLIFTVWIGIGDTDVFDLGGIIGAIIGVMILLPFVGVFARFRARSADGQRVSLTS